MYLLKYVKVYTIKIILYNMNYMNINIIYTWKYFQNIYCMCVYLYKHNKYTKYKHIM